MLKYKAGLHKEVSAIFNGVSLPNPTGNTSRQNNGQNNAAQQPSAMPAPTSQGSDTPKPSMPEPPTHKSPVPSHMTPNKPKPQPPPPQPSKETPAKQPKADTAVKAARQAPWQKTLEQIKSKLLATKSGAINTRQKMMVALAPILFIVVIFMFIRVFSTPSQKITGSEEAAPVLAVARTDAKVDWQIPRPYPTTLRDPMRFGSTSGQTGVGDLIVKAIVFSKDNPSAVIGNQIVHQGDKILDVSIVKIDENSVEFEARNKKWVQNVQR